MEAPCYAGSVAHSVMILRLLNCCFTLLRYAWYVVHFMISRMIPFRHYHSYILNAVLFSYRRPKLLRICFNKSVINIGNSTAFIAVLFDKIQPP